MRKLNLYPRNTLKTRKALGERRPPPSSSFPPKKIKINKYIEINKQKFKKKKEKKKKDIDLTVA